LYLYNVTEDRGAPKSAGPVAFVTIVDPALFPTCGTRTTGTRRSSRWYASNFHFFTI